MSTTSHSHIQLKLTRWEKVNILTNLILNVRQRALDKHSSLIERGWRGSKLLRCIINFTAIHRSNNHQDHYQ